MISNEGRFVIVLTFLTHVDCQSDDSCSKPGIYINNHFLPSARLSLERVRGLEKVFLVGLGQEIEGLAFPTKLHGGAQPRSLGEVQMCWEAASLGLWE